MKKKRVLSLVVLCLSFHGLARAADVLYARSNGDLQGDEKPGRYSALNILDDDKTTAWCSSGTGKGAKFEVVFSEKVDIDRIVFRVGNQKNNKTFKAFSRVREMVMVEGDMVHTVNLDDSEGEQTLQFDPVVNARRLIFKLTAGYRGDGRRHSCISDMTFFEGRRALNGKKFKPYIKKSRSSLPFLDTWVSGPEYAKNRELIFGVKGKYHFTFVPTDPMEKMVKFDAPYRIQSGDPQLRVGKKWVPVRVRRSDAGRVLKLKIERSEDTQRGMPGVYSRMGEKLIHH